MNRRNLLRLSAVAGMASALPMYGCFFRAEKITANPSVYERLIANLLLEWTNGLLAVQINQPQSPELHGALYCQACEKIHGRCMDAVYPFFHMADKTGEERYLDAALAVMDWSKNVSRPDGSWTVIPDPKSWRGITVFGAIALGEALHHHGHVLPLEIRSQWMERLAKAANFIYQNFTMTYSHGELCLFRSLCT